MPQSKFRQVRLGVLRPGGQDQKCKFREQQKIPRLRMAEAGTNAGTWAMGLMPREQTTKVRLSQAHGCSTGLKLDSAQVRSSKCPMFWDGIEWVGLKSPGMFTASIGNTGSQDVLERKEMKNKKCRGNCLVSIMHPVVVFIKLTKCFWCIESC